MALAEPNPVNGEVFGEMSFLVLLRGAASAGAGNQLGFVFPHSLFLQASGGDAGCG